MPNISLACPVWWAQAKQRLTPALRSSAFIPWTGTGPWPSSRPIVARASISYLLFWQLWWAADVWRVCRQLVSSWRKRVKVEKRLQRLFGAGSAHGGHARDLIRCLPGVLRVPYHTRAVPQLAVGHA